MAKGKARYGGSGRVTPKKDQIEDSVEPGLEGAAATRNSARYTPPTARDADPFVQTPLWVPIVMWGMLAIGVLMILLNYFSVLPGGQNNWWIVGGLGCITVGFVVATRLR